MQIHKQLAKASLFIVPRSATEDVFKPETQQGTALAELLADATREFRALERELDLFEAADNEQYERIERMEQTIDSLPRQIGDDLHRLLDITPASEREEVLRAYADSLRASGAAVAPSEELYLFDTGKPVQKELKFPAEQ
jgi:hypothetical protein